MIKFSQDKVLLLHQLMTQETGGDPGLRDIGLLDSALESAYATFDGVDLYPSKVEKAARLGYALQETRYFAGDPDLYYEPFGAVLPGLAHQEITLLSQERAK